MKKINQLLHKGLHTEKINYLNTKIKIKDLDYSDLLPRYDW